MPRLHPKSPANHPATCPGAGHGVCVRISEGPLSSLTPWFGERATWWRGAGAVALRGAEPTARLPSGCGVFPPRGCKATRGLLESIPGTCSKEPVSLPHYPTTTPLRPPRNLAQTVLVRRARLGRLHPPASLRPAAHTCLRTASRAGGRWEPRPDTRAHSAPAWLPLDDKPVEGSLPVRLRNHVPAPAAGALGHTTQSGKDQTLCSGGSPTAGRRAGAGGTEDGPLLPRRRKHKNCEPTAGPPRVLESGRRGSSRPGVRPRAPPDGTNAHRTG
ncbi:uncharacterized protein LOC123948728 [Meles meles]|uniref:uncharacterized protein LOC123948728 n=1 Tax=Meles meles TaxID=9662 RepID=UPI001E6A0EE9|nr:uncharacterized protein LOC123948728 [Meles meles]